MTLRRWIEYLVAILIGNGIYFLLLYPALPRLLQHQPFRFDAGLVLAFLCCVAVYAAMRLGVVHARRWNAKSGRADSPLVPPPAVDRRGEDGPNRSA